MQWADLLGMEEARGRLGKASLAGKMGHAHILAGPEGTGRRLFATMVARHLLCGRGGEGDLASCGQCPDCKQVEAGTHPDFQAWVKPDEDKEFKIDLMRKLIESSQLKPSKGRSKVFILEPADAFNDESSNCFLKTLEEPPPGMWIALLCENPDNLLPTIRSRCQMLRFQPLPLDAVAQILVSRGLADANARIEVARLSEGLPGLAVLLAEPSRRTLWNDCLGTILTRPFRGSAWADRIKGFIEDVTGGPAQRSIVRSILRLHMGLWSDLLRAFHGLNPRIQPESAARAIVEITRRIDDRRLAGLSECTLAADDRLKWGAMVPLAIEAMGDAMEDLLNP